ncbi:MAG: 50S ribosomal protein L32e, partial [Halobacteria archaeon]|nr:50S ribosomal protein L32e [Halobacteria archaeon]
MAEEKGLTDIDGVGETKADSLRDAGYETVEDVKRASQDELASVEGVGKALAARIKADVGGLEVEEDVEVEEVGVEEEEEEVETVEEEEEIITAVELSDKKPELDDETEELLRKKKRQNNPSFKRQDHHKKKRVPTSWRRPLGSHSRRRKQVKGKGGRAGIGHGTPSEVRGLHPSGFEEVLVHRPDELDDVDPSTQAVRIGGSVGGRKRERIEEKALEEEIR